MTCEQCREDLSAYLDDMLGEDERKRVREHIKGCAACAESLSELGALVRLTQTLECDPPTAFSDAWREAVRNLRIKKPLAWTYRMGAVAAALVIAVTAWRIWPQISGMGAPMNDTNMAAPQLASQPAPPESFSAKLALVSPDAESAPSGSAENAAGGGGGSQASDSQANDSQANGASATEAPDARAAEPAALAPSAAPQPSESGTAPQMGIAEVPAAQQDASIASITFEFGNTDLTKANSILTEALNRLGMIGTMRNGVWELAVLNAKQSEQLIDVVRTITAERGMGEPSVVCTPGDAQMEVTKITVSVK